MVHPSGPGEPTMAGAGAMSPTRSSCRAAPGSGRHTCIRPRAGGQVRLPGSVARNLAGDIWRRAGAGARLFDGLVRAPGEEVLMRAGHRHLLPRPLELASAGRCFAVPDAGRAGRQASRAAVRIGSRRPSSMPIPGMASSKAR